MKEVSRGQALQVSARLATQVKWEEINGEKLQSEVINLSPEEFGRRFTNFLKNSAQYPNVKSPNIFTVTSNGVPYGEVPKYLEGKGYVLDQPTKYFFERLSSPIDAFGTLPTAGVTVGVTYLLGIIFGGEFSDDERTIANVQREALRRGWRKAPVETVSLARLKFRHGKLDELRIPMLWIMHEPILNGTGFDALILGGDKYGGLYRGYAVPHPDQKLHRINNFAFLVPQFGE
ncbi:MAG: hypothetical protein WC878_05835 [Candidatus Paceibacterota bacterium]|jgi:hypothetical protein